MASEAETKTAFRRVAVEFAGAFETARRVEDDPGSSFTRLRDVYRDTWAQEIVFEAHGDMLPDDWRYACIAAAAEAIAEHEDEDEAQDGRGDFADGYVDVYNSALIEWLASHGGRVGYCDEAVVEIGGEDSGTDTMRRLQLGQYYEADEVYGLVLAGIVARVEGLESDMDGEGEA